MPHDLSNAINPSDNYDKVSDSRGNLGGHHPEENQIALCSELNDGTKIWRRGRGEVNGGDSNLNEKRERYMVG